MRVVELHQAFTWICDDCGRDNFSRAIRVEPESIEGQEIAQLVNRAVAEANEATETLGLMVNGDWIMAPEVVRCTYCKSLFRTRE